MSLPYNRTSMHNLDLSNMYSIQQTNRSPNGHMSLDCQMDQSSHNLFAFQPPQPTYSMDMNIADGDNEFDWGDGFGNFIEEGYAQQDDHQFESTNRLEGTAQQIQSSTVRPITTLNSNASTEDHLLTFGNEFDVKMFNQMNRTHPMESWQSEASNTPPFMEHYGQRQYNSYDKVGRMESYESEASNTPPFMEHNDHVHRNSYDELDRMERGESGAANQVGSPNRLEGTAQQIQISTVRSITTLNSNASTRLSTFGNEFDQEMFYQVNRTHPMGMNQSTNTRPFMEVYSYDKANRCESMAIEQMESHATACEEEAKTNESAIVRNRPQWNPHWQCDHCKQSFYTKADLISHLQLNTAKFPFQCDHCRELFAHKCNLIIHVLEHFNERPIKCKLCDWSFNEKRNLKSHVESIHLSIRHRYRCTICRNYFSTSTSTFYHIRVIHFGLPRWLKDQRARNIIDHRDAREFIEKCDI